MKILLFLLSSTAYPAEHVDEGSTTLINTGLEEFPDDAPIPTERLSFMTTLLVKSSEAEPAVSDFKCWWAENAGGEITLESLAVERDQLDPSRAGVLDDMEAGGWSFKSSFVAFAAGSDDAEAEARQLIHDSDLKTH